MRARSLALIWRSIFGILAFFHVRFSCPEIRQQLRLIKNFVNRSVIFAGAWIIRRVLVFSENSLTRTLRFACTLSLKQSRPPHRCGSCSAGQIWRRRALIASMASSSHLPKPFPLIRFNPCHDNSRLNNAINLFSISTNCFQQFSR
jgi:hypothetical protein